MLELSAVRLERHSKSLCSHQKVSQPRQIMSECIRLLAQRVQDPQLSASDHTISAVTTLAGIEVCVSVFKFVVKDWLI